MTMKSGKTSRWLLTCAPAALMAAWALMQCAPLQTASTGGSGSETQNALIVISDHGRLHGVSGPQDVAGAYGGSYVPYKDSGFDTTVSSSNDGGFDFGVLDTGVYNVLVQGADGARGAFFSSIRVGPRIGPDTFGSVLGPLGSVSGTVMDTAGIAYRQLPVYIQGSPFFDKSDDTGFFSIKDVPAGSFVLATRDVVSRGRRDTLSARQDVSLAGGESKSIEMLMLTK
jgi:hypothetical protein